jgi:hypothetical protein
MIIRTEILNLNLSQWDKIHELDDSGKIDISVKEFYELIGFDGGMFLSCKANKEELKFIREFYEYGRNN